MSLKQSTITYFLFLCFFLCNTKNSFFYNISLCLAKKHINTIFFIPLFLSTICREILFYSCFPNSSCFFIIVIGQSIIAIYFGNIMHNKIILSFSFLWNSNIKKSILIEIFEFQLIDHGIKWILCSTLSFFTLPTSLLPFNLRFHIELISFWTGFSPPKFIPYLQFLFPIHRVKFPFSLIKINCSAEHEKF